MDIQKYLDLKGKNDTPGNPLVSILKSDNTTALSWAQFDATGTRIADTVEQIFPDQIQQTIDENTAANANLNVILGDINDA